jgi:30S ribosomal protein S31
MGKGDIKSKRGKIINGSFGKKRPHGVKPSVTQKNEKNTEKSAK